MMMFVAFLLFRFWRRAEVGLQVVLGAGRELIQVSEEHGYFPHVIAAECFVPGGHARVADASADGIEDVPIGIVRRIGNEIGWWWIEGCSERRRLPVESSVAESAIHGIELHAVFQVLIGR